ncbi:MAG: hypothetical protein JRF40_09375 [Deltaproteobacteria bacterium]|nr:hypothetical protein [Deltaproteobacteria bacterium]
MGMIKKKRCRNCKRLFIPDYRNRKRQKYCKRAECRKASKAASQKQWVNKPENRNYFLGPEHVQRVQEWRKQHPGYWKPKNSNKAIALQDPLKSQLSENKKDSRELPNNALQDLLKVQPPVMIGLISNFIGSALQDDIAETLLRMQQSGQDILYCQPQKRGGKDDCKISNFTPTGA